MGNKRIIIGVFGAVIGSHAAAFAAVEGDLGALSVKVKTAKVRAEPKAWAGTVASLSYGDSIKALSVTDGWIKVRTAGGKQGYLHESAVTSKKVVLAMRGGAGDGATDRTDVVLAGKGFNQAVERDLAANDSSLNFKAVDEMERLRVSDADLAAFIKAGQLGKKG